VCGISAVFFVLVGRWRPQGRVPFFSSFYLMWEITVMASYALVYHKMGHEVSSSVYVWCAALYFVWLMGSNMTRRGADTDTRLLSILRRTRRAAVRGFEHHGNVYVWGGVGVFVKDDACVCAIE